MLESRERLIEGDSMKRCLIQTLPAFLVFVATTSGQVPESIERVCYENVCLVQSKTGPVSSLGTGIYLGQANGTGIVSTAAHVVEDGGQLFCNFPDGDHVPATLVSIDHTWDIATLALTRPVDRSGVDIASANPKRGETLYAYGYPNGRTDKWLVGQMTANRSAIPGGPGDWVEFQGGAIEGMSGGPVFNANGEYVGPLWGTDGYTTTCTSTGRFQSFMGTLFGPIRQWRANRLGRLMNIPAPDI